MAKRGRPTKLSFGYLAATGPMSVPDVDWGGRFDGPETVSDDVPKPDMAVKLLTVETDSQIDIIMKQGADGIEARLDRLVAENPHWGRLR
jgi:hypothetical protein